MALPHLRQLSCLVVIWPRNVTAKMRWSSILQVFRAYAITLRFQGGDLQVFLRSAFHVESVPARHEIEYSKSRKHNSLPTQDIQYSTIRQMLIQVVMLSASKKL